MFHTRSLYNTMLWLLLMMPCLSFSADSVVKTYNIDLTDSQFAKSINIDIDLTSRDDFKVEIISESTSPAAGADYFILNPSVSRSIRKNDPVKFAINFPYNKMSAGGGFNLTDENRVIPGKPKYASTKVSACSILEKESIIKICKRLSFVIIDDEFAISGTRYTADLLLKVTTTDKNSIEAVNKIKLHVTYEKHSSPFGIRSFNNKTVELERGNYTGEREFCIWSQDAKSFPNFQVRLENKKNLHAFELYDGHGHIVPYKAEVKFDNRAYKAAAPLTWIQGGTTRQTSRSSECANRNLTVRVSVAQDTWKSYPGKYHGQLTVRVKAQ